jgi:long-chain acyl-CoA synthetase
VATEPPFDAGRTIARLARQVERATAVLDLTLSQYRVLGLLREGTEAASALAEKLAVSRPSITGVIDGLVARGLVERRPDGGDRRRIGLELTAEGRRVLAQTDAQVQRRLAEIAAHVDGGGPEAFAALTAALTPWQRALDAHRAARQREAGA